MSYPDLSTLRKRLKGLEHSNTSLSDKHIQAAVLILFHQGNNGPEIILTRRSEHLPTHGGQISFPGGRVDENDKSVVMTALREAHEEVAVHPRAVEVLGCMQQVILPSGFCVSPVLGLCESLPELLPNPGEVAEIFSLPLHFILQSELFQHGTYDISGIKRSFYYFDYKEYYIWGATAAMLRSLAQQLNE